MFETYVKSSRGDSRIVVCNGAFAGLGGRAAEAVAGRRACVVTDAHVAGHHLEPALASLRAAGFVAESVVVPAGETSKSVDGLVSLWHAFNDCGLTRADLVVALGGGVVGDLAGFAAATYLRGVAIVQVPTTLLAQVDSSVGGKTGIDLPFGKNLAGAFHQPAVVVVDPLLLGTLPRNRFAEGMAEVVKYGCIADAGLFADLDAFADSPGDAEALLAIIQRCVQIKADVVNRDALDTGERMLLNFGHTVGHAIEKAMGYGAIAHGEAVAIGMVAAARLGEALGETPDGTAARLEALLKRFALPTTTTFTAADLFATMLADKKRLGKQIHFILLERIGRAVRRPFEPAALRQALDGVLADVARRET
ncbi:MAG: 3-dehydroquinate synthase [Kiritimatiellia bacterium]|jgi:3-dehydroquinate synthase